jgi:hypothetical protein
MHYLGTIFGTTLFWTGLLLAGSSAAADLELPAGISTHPDGRMPIEELYRSYLTLLDKGWELDIVTRSRPEGRSISLPIIALRTRRTGDAAWILSGVHGEEPAGPNAIALSLEDITALGDNRAVVLLPLNNPHGYVHNWRYLNREDYSETQEGQSVGDSSHLLADTADPTRPRAPGPSSPEADAITAYILAQLADYPPAASIDLHEDNLIHEGYVYSQGRLGATDPLALIAVRALQDNGIALKMGGETRFGEPIFSGIIGPVTDSSIDELMSAEYLVVGGQQVPGPAARTVLVFETPAARVTLTKRVNAHAALLKQLTLELSSRSPQSDP